MRNQDIKQQHVDRKINGKNKQKVNYSLWGKHPKNIITIIPKKGLWYINVFYQIGNHLPFPVQAYTSVYPFFPTLDMLESELDLQGLISFFLPPLSLVNLHGSSPHCS